LANSNISKKLAQAINGGSLLNNTISITGAQGAIPGTVYSANSIGAQNLSTQIDWGTDSHVKKYHVFEIEKDFLALSCAWQRIRASRKEGQLYEKITKLTDTGLFRALTQEDHDKAAQVRDYYSKKIMLWKLKGESLSRFREDMNSFIHTDGKIFKEDMMPLVYRLPEFYDYDSDFDVLSNEYNKKVNQDTQNVIGKKQLKLAKTYIVSKKHSKRKEYWFSDEYNNLVSLSVELHNPLLTLLDVYAQHTIKVDAIYTKRNRDNSEYLIANKFKFT
jgi:hypothetical protein